MWQCTVMALIACCKRLADLLVYGQIQLGHVTKPLKRGVVLPL